MRSMPRARIAYARNLPKRFRVKSLSRHGEPAGKAFSSGNRTTNTAAAPVRRARSRVGIAPLDREETGGPPLDEQDHEDEDEDLAVHGPEGRLDDLVQPADAEGGQDTAEQLAHAAGHHDHERVHDVVLAELRTHVADLREGAAGQPREPGPEGEG